jgi:peptidyl-prolyl cis-trans isomerase SurA
MKRWKRWAISIFACVVLAVPVRAGEVVDRIVANVNGHILLQSDWEEELAFEAFANARPLDALTPAERKAALDRLIDQELLREQVRPLESAPAELVAARVAEIRKTLLLTSDEGWRASLQRYGLTQPVLEKRLGNDIQLMRLVEARLRPSVQVDTRAVESYYRERLLPELQRAGSKAVSLPEVFGHIRDLLTEQKVNQLLDSWLVSLRSESRIQTSESTAGEQAR